MAQEQKTIQKLHETTIQKLAILKLQSVPIQKLTRLRNYPIQKLGVGAGGLGWGSNEMFVLIVAWTYISQTRFRNYPIQTRSSFRIVVSESAVV